MPNPHANTDAAVFIRRQLELLAPRKTQREISDEAGFANGNMISQFKTGASKIPLDRVPAIARAIEVDPAILMTLALAQAVGKTAAGALLATFGMPTTQNERVWIEEIREASGHTDPALTTGSKAALRAILG